MAVYKLKAKQRGPKCSFCNSCATYRGFMFAQFSCDAHRPKLVSWDTKETRADLSEAEFYAGY